ncbi:MAG: Ig-like domain-containing protein [Clostridiales bacterium]|nr:Ig-like domain-containing protein [Clostridiales bacterium]
MVVIVSMNIAYADGYAVNDDFESTSTPFDNATYSNMTGGISSEECYSGAASYYMNAASEDASVKIRLSEYDGVENILNTNDMYEVSFYAKPQAGSGVTGIKVGYSYYKSLRWNNVEVETVSFEDETGFVKVIARFIPSNASRLSILLEPVGGGGFYIDDFCFGKREMPKILAKECNPANGAFDVSLDTDITVVFDSEPQTAPQTENFLINGSSDNIAAVAQGENSKTYILTLANDLEQNTEYTVSVSGLKDVSGLDYIGNFTFKTIDNSLEMTITESNPADNASDVSVLSDITLTFSMEVVNNSFDGCFALNGIEIPNEAVTKTANNKLVIDLDKLDGYTHYELSVSGIMGKNTNVTKPCVIAFKTGEAQADPSCVIDFDENMPEYTTNWNSTIEMVTENAYRGKSAKMIFQTGSSNYKVQVTADTGVLYKYSYMVSAAQANTKMKVAVSYAGSDYQNSVSETIPVGEYIQCEGTFIVPAGTSHWGIMLQFWGTAGTFYIDDIKLTPVAEFNVISSTVTDGEKNVAADETITLNYNAEIAAVTSIALNEREIAEDKYSISGKTLNLNAQLLNATAYTLAVKAKDVYGRETSNTISFETEPEFIIGSYTLTETSPGTVRLDVADFKNNTQNQRKPVLKILVIKDGVLLVPPAEKIITVAAGDTVSDKLEFTLPSDIGSGYTVKATIWDSENGIMPIVEAITK